MMFKRPESLMFNEGRGIYGQNPEKFVGYGQFPRSKVNPYFNNRNLIRLNPKKRKMIPKNKSEVISRK